MAFIRTFIAFDTPEWIKLEIKILQTELKKSNADVKWEKENKFHCTIKFLGDVEETILPKVISTCEDIISQLPKFDVTYQRLGCFPNKKRPRVIWIGCENRDGTLIKIKNFLDKNLLQYGFEIEERQFNSHITLGRVRNPISTQNLTPMLESLTFEPRGDSITNIQIIKSILRQGGSEYTILKTIKLKE